jgi:hypothetical protein
VWYEKCFRVAELKFSGFSDFLVGRVTKVKMGDIIHVISNDFFLKPFEIRRTGMNRKSSKHAGMMIAILLALSVFYPMAGWADSLVPTTFNAKTGVGETVSVKRTVTITKEVSSAKIDIFFLFDTTGSMRDTIEAAQLNASEILSNASKMGDVSFGVGYYQDFPVADYGGKGDVAYQQLQDITDNAESVKNAIDHLPLGWGGDGPEANLYALSEVASKTSWRKDSIRIVIWFGDCPGHDGKSEASYPSRIGLSDVITTLKSGDIIVEAVDLALLDQWDKDDVYWAEYNYLAGQATAITTATGGKIFTPDGGDISGIVKIIDDALKSAFAEYKEVKLVFSGKNAGLGAEISPAAITGSFDRSAERIFDFNITYKGLVPGSYQFDVLAKLDNKTVAVAKDTVEVSGQPECPAKGAFTVGDAGLVRIDWLYDGGKYQGEFGIFSLTGMESLTPGSPEFIAEAVRRVMSDSEQGYPVFSDLSEGARFSGLLGGEVRDWNAGPYRGVKSFAMKPGSCFATVLVPNSTFVSLSQDTATTDTNRRPLFSLVSPSPAYGMSVGQMADVSGMGRAYSYEDKDAATSDWDFNDLIIQITGASGNVPSVDELKALHGTRSARRDGTDWRTSELGRLILAHAEAPAPTAETLSMSITLNSADTLLVYDPAGKVIGRDGGWISGASFELKADGTQAITLPNPTGSYRVSIQGAATAQSTLTVKTYQGSAELSSSEIPADIAPRRILTTTVSADTQPPTVAPLNAAIGYDFNGDGVTDNTDVEMLVKHWNSCKGQQKYDAFFDVNDDGCITVADIMAVLNAKTVK